MTLHSRNPISLPPSHSLPRNAPGVAEGVTIDRLLQLVREAEAQRVLAGRRDRRDSGGGVAAAFPVDLVPSTGVVVFRRQQLVERILVLGVSLRRLTRGSLLHYGAIANWRVKSPRVRTKSGKTKAERSRKEKVFFSSRKSSHSLFFGFSLLRSFQRRGREAGSW